MDFAPDNRYVITAIESTTDNYIHDEMRGRPCQLESCEVGDVCWMRVLFEDGCWHSIHTSKVKDVGASDFNHDITVKTRNSVYTFSMVTEGGGDHDAA